MTTPAKARIVSQATIVFTVIEDEDGSQTMDIASFGCPDMPSCDAGNFADEVAEVANKMVRIAIDPEAMAKLKAKRNGATQ